MAEIFGEAFGGSISEQIASIAAGVAEGDVPLGNPARAISDLQGAGWNASQGLQLMRALGGAIANQRWYRLWSEVAADAANRSNIARVALDQVIPREYHTAWSAGQAGRFAYQSRGYTWRTITNPDGSTSSFMATVHHTTYSTTPMTPDEVIADLEAEVERANAYGTPLGTYVGGFVDAAYYTIGRNG